SFLLAVLTVPVHGVVLGPGPDGTTIVRTDPVTHMVPAQTRTFRISPHMQLPSGTGIDAFIDRSREPWRLYDAAVAAKFVPGLPDPGTGFPIDLGSQLPHTKLVDQNGRLVDLAADFRGKVTLISFIFTRCPDQDECPLVSSKFAYMQQHLDASRFHLIEISLDPVYDSPAVLHDYARQYGANARAWSIVTGQPHDIERLLGRFGISSLQESDAKFIHNDKVFVVAQNGKVADIVQSTAFAASALVAQARHMAGLASNPFGRLQLALVAGAVALCGGSQFAGVVLLETVLFLIIAVVSFATLAWVARKMWRRA
ncbi:MAG TPA: SCO family protein, partial [Candidatus Baltobacteraceae bacterium]|nr:SCO family protein [Candidatus Baltobacteraceae bacterium]